MMEWLDSITAEVLVSQFSKVPALMQADRNDANVSCFKRYPGGKW